jgi:hypothetical protein
MLRRKDVMAFLLDVYSVYGIAAARDLARKLEGEPPPRRRRMIALRRSR